MNKPMSQLDRSIHRIDGDDRLVFVSAAWLRHAAENGAPELTEAAVLGRPIWDFIAGENICRLLGELFHRVRHGTREIVVPFRCDSPELIRHMEMRLRTIAGPGRPGIEFENREVARTRRLPVALLDRQAARSAEQVPICSICRRLSLDGEWLDIDALLVRRRLLSGSPLPRLEEAVCSSCEDRLSRL